MTRVLLTFFIVFCNLMAAQPVPPITGFNPSDYEAANQNWMISQGNDRVIYVANNAGLLEYNGQKWQVYPTPNGSSIRSVMAVDHKVYTGFYRDFGYWERNSYGILEYYSLAKKLSIEIFEDEQFWNIYTLDGNLVFQSLDRLIILNAETGNLNIIAPERGVAKSFLVEGELYYSDSDGALYGFRNGASEQMITSRELKGDAIIGLFSNKEGLNAVLQSGNISVGLSTTMALPLTGEIFSFRESEKGYIIGTISEGLHVYDKDFHLRHRIDQSTGLPNNTILSIYEDADSNLWVGMDKGLAHIDLRSNVLIFKDRDGMIGTVYASILHNDRLYLGSNQGLFIYSTQEQKFQLVENTAGQVWKLQLINNELYCSHNRGFLKIDEEVAEPLMTKTGVWTATELNNDGKLLLGTYEGLILYDL